MPCVKQEEWFHRPFTISKLYLKHFLHFVYTYNNIHISHKHKFLNYEQECLIEFHDINSDNIYKKQTVLL